MVTILKVFFATVFVVFFWVVIDTQLAMPTIPLISPLLTCIAAWVFWYLYPQRKLVLCTITLPVVSVPIAQLFIVGFDHPHLLAVAGLIIFTFAFVVGIAEYDRRKNLE